MFPRLNGGEHNHATTLQLPGPGTTGNPRLTNTQNFLSWWRSKPPRVRLFNTLATAQTYEEWEEAAFQLDELLGGDLWYELGWPRRHHSVLS